LGQLLRYCRQGGVASKYNQDQALLVFTLKKNVCITKNVQVSVADVTGGTSEKCDMHIIINIAILQ